MKPDSRETFWQGILANLPTAIIIAVVGLLCSILFYYLGRKDTGNDQARQEQQHVADLAREDQKVAQQRQLEAINRAEQQREEEPRLECIKRRLQTPGKPSDSLLTFVNRAKGTRHANISRVTFTITEPENLERLAKVFPRPRKDPGVGVANHVDPVFFREGVWAGRDAFVFCVELSLHISPVEGSDLQLAIVNPKLGGQQFVGDLDVSYDSGGEYTSHCDVTHVTIYGRRE